VSGRAKFISQLGMLELSVGRLISIKKLSVDKNNAMLMINLYLLAIVTFFDAVLDKPKLLAFLV